MITVTSRTPDAPVTAADWFAARQGRPGDPALERSFEHWLSADPEHQRQYALCEIAWDLAGSAAAKLPDAVAAQPRRILVRASRWGTGLSLAASLLVALAVLWQRIPTTSPARQYVTGPGEQQLVALDDGSRVTLNTRTEIEVEMSGDSRRVVLKRGEAFFDVARDERRPFRVLTSLGEVRVLGTRFTVYQRQQSIEVSTEQGLVRVLGAGSRDETSAVLVPPGNSAIIPAAGRRPEMRHADLERIRNWRRRLLEFDAVPLADLLEEFSRYTPVPIRAADDELGALRVSGVFHIGDTVALSQALTSAFGLIIRQSGSGPLIVERPESVRRPPPPLKS